MAISDQVTVPTERLKLSYDKTPETNLLNDNLKILEKNILSISDQNSSEEFDKVIDYIIHARRVYLLGSRARVGLVETMGVFLNQVIDNIVVNGTNAFTPFDTLAYSNEDDCVLILSFPRYSDVDVAAVKMAKEAGSKIVAVTDKATSPVAQFADVLLLVSVDSNAFFNSYTPVLFLAELICMHVSRAALTRSEENLDRINRHISQFGMY